MGKKALHLWSAFPNIAVWTGLEPATPCVTGMYSNQLNYRTILFVTAIPLNCDAKIGDVFESCNTSSQLFFIFFYSYLIIKQLFVKKKWRKIMDCIYSFYGFIQQSKWPKRQFITKQVHYNTFFNTKTYLCLYIATFVT